MTRPVVEGNVFLPQVIARNKRVLEENLDSWKLQNDFLCIFFFLANELFLSRSILGIHVQKVVVWN